MKCPRCEASVLDERERDGVTIDVCQKCRGIWLDRGELERLMARASEEQEALERQHGRKSDYDDDHERYRDRSYPHHKPHPDEYKYRNGRRRKRTWLETISDVFD